MRRYHSPSFLLVLSLTALSACGVAFGEEATRGATLEDVVVTAQKREQRLIDVPLAVTAVSAAEISERGVVSLQDMQYSVPGLTLAETGPGVGRVQLNGIGIAGGSTGLPVVAFYLDEMPITAPGGGDQMDIRLLDIERVEVLHGPQPTLYGEGAMGGTIHYVTASPDLNKFGGHVEGTAGSVKDGAESYRAQAVINAPLVPGTLGLRVAAQYEKDGGWIDSNYTGAKDINSLEVKTVRAKLLYAPTSNVSVSLMAMHQEHDEPYQNFSNYDRTSNIHFPLANTDKSDIGNLIINWNAGPVSLISSTGYLHREPHNAYDLTQYLLPFLGFFGLPPNVIASIQTIGWPLIGVENMFSQEVRLSSNNTGPLNYIVGVYYRDFRTSSLDATVTSPGQLPFKFFDTRGVGSSKTLAEFVELRYAFSDRLEALVGLRHFHEDQAGVTSGDGIFDPPAPVPVNASFQSNNPRLNVSYKTWATGRAYANLAKGFRSGQSNVPTPGTPPTVGPESLWTLTVGSKDEWLNRRLITDVSVFRNRYTDIQTLQVSLNNPNGYYANAGKATGTGVNLGISARPSDEFTLSGTLAYTDAHYDNTTVGTYAGDPIHMVAKWTYSAAVDYRRPLGASSTLLSRIDYQHTSGYTLTIHDIPPPAPPYYFADARNIVNARLGIDFGKYQAFLFANNLTDDNGSVYPAVGAFPEPVLSTPRTIGLEVKFDF
jgi:iron complex outermembrane receptor protein